MDARKYTFNFICSDDVSLSIKLTYSDFDMEVKTFEDLIEDFKQKIKINSKAKLRLNTLHLEEIPTPFYTESLSYIYSLSPFYFQKSLYQDLSVNIELKCSNGKIITLTNVDVNNKVEVMKNLIQDMEGIAADQQKLIFDGQLLEDSKTLRDYQITKDSIIDFLVRQKGLVREKCFVDLEENKTKTLNFSKEAPKWRACKKGLNVFGECENEKCIAFKKEVICPIDLECFDLILDSHIVECPNCKENFIPKTCGFWKCSFSWTGIKLEKRKEKRFSKPKWTVVGDTFQYFDPKGNGSAEWRQLKILTKIEPQKERCGVCLNETDDTCRSKECGHLYHSHCNEVLEFRLNMDCVLCM